MTEGRRWLPAAWLLGGLAGVTGCGETARLEPGVPRELARARAARIGELAYDVRLSVPAGREEPITGAEVIEFELSEAGGPVVLDFLAAADRVRRVRVDDRDVAFKGEAEHLVIEPGAFHEGANAVTIDFVAGDGSLNRRADYLYTLFVPERARYAIPVLDQPDLKARFTLHLELPAGWRAVANGPLMRHRIDGDRAYLDFAPTRPISTYLFAFAAGRFEVETAERHGRTMHMYHREFDAAKVARNRDAIFDLHARALAWLEEYTGIPYPFDKFDFVLVPAFQYGGMEHPGAILYRAAGLMLDESATQNQLLGRASVIAHETAHMWFGDLVTMRWFNDVWMKEVFANFMAAKIVNPAFPDVDHDLRFFLAHYPAAYAVDRTAGANAIRQSLDNLNDAGSLYGAIIYQKAPIVMRHLERLMGEDVFRDGLREYLHAHRYANATWPDLIDVLDRRTEENLAAWSRVWVEEPGRPTVAARVTTAGDTITGLEVEQRDESGQERVWPQTLRVALGDGRGTRAAFDIPVRSEPVSVGEAIGLPAPAWVLPNADGVAYGRMVLDDASLRYLVAHLGDLDSPEHRAVAWLDIREAMLDGRVSPGDVMAMLLDALPRERVELNTQALVNGVTSTFWRFLDDAERESVAPQVESALWQLLTSAGPRTRRSTLFRGYRSVALSAVGVDRLRRLWAGTDSVPGLPLSERDLTALAEGLAVRGVPDAEAILDRQRARIDNPDRRARFDFVRPSLSADDSVRAAFFARLADPVNRTHEPWVLSGLGYLHHPLRARSAIGFIRPSLDRLEEIRRTGDIFFPGRWIAATLGGHQSPEAAQVVRRFLAEHPDLPVRLREKLLQSADELFRAAAILHDR